MNENQYTIHTLYHSYSDVKKRKKLKARSVSTGQQRVTQITLYWLLTAVFLWLRWALLTCSASAALLQTVNLSSHMAQREASCTSMILVHVQDERVQKGMQHDNSEEQMIDALMRFSKVPRTWLGLWAHWTPARWLSTATWRTFRDSPPHH